MNVKQFFVLLLAAIALGVVLLAVATADFSNFGRGLLPTSGASCVGVLRLQGEIDDQPQGRFFSTKSMSEEISDALASADEDNAVGSVLLAVNSPGGGAVASKEIHDAIKETKKPVVAYMGEVAASGGYYVASSSDYIVANPNTITGSIGIRATVLNYQELFSKLGLRVDSFTTGELKDLGAGYRNITEKERRVLTGLLNDTFDNFRDDVVKARGDKLNKKLFNETLDARVLTAKQALSIGLIDEIGSRSDALRKAAQLGNVSVEEGELPQTCELEEPSFAETLFGGFASAFAKSLAQASKPRLTLRYEAYA